MSKQLLATAWVQHLQPPSFQGDDTRAAVSVLDALSDATLCVETSTQMQLVQHAAIAGSC